MDKIKGFANYGVLQHEKRTIFTCGAKHPHATASVDVEICLPEGFTAHTNDLGEVLIEIPSGVTYTANDILTSHNNCPVMAWYDGEAGHRVKCDYLPF